jgi:hypothetical protein
MAVASVDLESIVARLSNDDLRRIGHLAERELKRRINKEFEDKLILKLKDVPGFQRCTVSYDDSLRNSEKSITDIHFNFDDNTEANVHIEITIHLYTSAYEVLVRTSFGEAHTYSRVTEIDTNTLHRLEFEGWTLYDTAKLLEIVMMTTCPRYWERYMQLPDKIQPERWENTPIPESEEFEELDLYDFALREGYSDIEVTYNVDTFEEHSLIIFYNNDEQEVARINSRWDRRYNIFPTYKVEYSGDIDVMKYIPVVMPIYGEEIVKLEEQKATAVS